MLKIILLGAPGAGKGTQGNLISKKYGFPKISTGDILREAVKNRTPLGMKAKEKMDKGELVDDEIILGIIKERVLRDDCKEGFILDGFPRNIKQAEEFEKLGIEGKELAILFDVKDEEIIRRLSSRRVCKKCGAIYNLVVSPPKKEGICDKCGGELIQRDDDKPEVIKRRLSVYKEQTEPLVEFYEKKGILGKVNAEGEIEEIFNSVCDIIGQYL